MAAERRGGACRPSRRLAVVGRVLDQGYDPRRHEAGRTHGLAGAGDLGDLDHAAAGGDLDAAAGLGGQDLERLRAATADVDQHLDSVALHRRFMVGRAVMRIGDLGDGAGPRRRRPHAADRRLPRRRQGHRRQGRADERLGPNRTLLADDGTLEVALGGFLVRHGDKVVLVDTGVGLIDVAPFHGGQFIDNLAALGVSPGDVTDVLFTHLHFDHVGWATSKGAVVFPNATYRCHRHDWAHFFGPDAGATRKLTPIADRIELWDTDTTILPGIDTITAPGHTPGSTIMVLSSGEERAMLLGDVVHCPDRAARRRVGRHGRRRPRPGQAHPQALARELEGTDTPVAAAHFPGLQFGRLLAGQGTRRWVFSGRCAPERCPPAPIAGNPHIRVTRFGSPTSIGSWIGDAAMSEARRRTLGRVSRVRDAPCRPQRSAWQSLTTSKRLPHGRTACSEPMGQPGC